MDPLTALGLATNIITFLDFGFKVVATAVEIHGSTHGNTEENRSCELIVAELNRLASRLQPQDETNLTESEASLCVLARECENIGNHMIELLGKIKPQDHSRLSSFRAGLKNKWYQQDLKRFEERLVQCRGQLNLQLSYITSFENKEKLEVLVSNSRDNSAKLNQLNSQIDMIRQDSDCKFLSLTSRNQLEPLLGVTERASDLIAQHHILKSLAFDGMYGRYEAVENAHFDTFRWIYDDSEVADMNGTSNKIHSADEDGLPGASGDDAINIISATKEIQEPVVDRAKIELIKNSKNGTSKNAIDANSEDRDLIKSCSETNHIKPRAKRILIDWLLHGNGIFHVSGKLGSGKSTLMKYLYEEEHTTSLLQKWAGVRKLVFTSFFFWKPGSTLQNSLTGLFRSLLHDVLKSCPELIPDVFPKQWNLLKSSPWQTGSDIVFGNQDIRSAFLELLSDGRVYKDHCFCFWIDGLDEYEGTYQDDPKALIDMLCSWTKLAPNAVKLCVSSREHNVFMNALSSDQRIRLHELTQTDIRRYISSKLDHLYDQRNKSTLIESVVKNAHGIFLWVVLVVRRIRERIEDGSSLNDLLEEVENLPRELDDLFQHIIDSLSPRDLKKAYQTFSMLMRLSKYSSPRLTILAYSFLDDYMANPLFSIEWNLEQSSLSEEERSLRETLTRKRLNGCCRGLVEVIDPAHTGEVFLALTHRSIPEFFADEGRRDHITSVLGDFSPTDALSQLALAELLADPSVVEQQGNGSLLSWLVYMRTQTELDSEPYNFLESLSEALAHSEKPVTLKELESKSMINSLELLMPNFASADLGSIVLRCPREADPKLIAAATAPHDPIYAATLCGNFGYVKWKLRKSRVDPEVISMDLLLHCFLYACKGDPSDIKDMVEVIITHGNFGPNAISSAGIIELNEQETEAKRETKLASLAVWWHLLVSCYRWGNRERSNWEIILEKYLEHGADPYFELRASFGPTDLRHNALWSYARGGGMCQITLILGKEKKEKLVEFPTLSAFTSNESFPSLSSYIQSLNFKNEYRLLELVRRNMGIVDGAGEDVDTKTHELEQHEAIGPLAYGSVSNDRDLMASNEECTKDETTSRRKSAPISPKIPRLPLNLLGILFSAVLAVFIAWVFAN